MAEKPAEPEKRLRETRELLESARSVLEYREFEPTARTVFESCRRLTGAVSGYVALLSRDGSQNEVLFLESGGLPCTVDPDLPMPIRGLRAESYKERKVVYDNDFSSSEWMRFMPPGHVELRSVMFAPLILEGKAVGLIGLANKPGGFDDDDSRIATVFAEIAAVALHNSRTYELLEASEARYREAAENLARANEELKGYSHTVSHDLKGPLSAIRLAHDILKELLETGFPDEMTGDIKESLDIIGASSRKADSLIEGLLELAEAGQVPVEVETVEVGEAVASVLQDKAGSMAEKGVRVNVDEELGTVVASPVHIYQLFSNLVGNAIKHNDSTDPFIEISRLEDSESGDHRYLIRDNGSGIPHDYLDKIFFPFFKGRETGDTGIGLSTVSKIIDIYGGSIRAYNDGGACFEFAIPDFRRAGQA